MSCATRSNIFGEGGIKRHLLQRLLSASTRDRHHAKGSSLSTMGAAGRALG
jgi:hypothetical protein